MFAAAPGGGGGELGNAVGPRQPVGDRSIRLDDVGVDEIEGELTAKALGASDADCVRACLESEERRAAAGEGARMEDLDPLPQLRGRHPAEAS